MKKSYVLAIIISMMASSLQAQGQPDFDLVTGPQLAGSEQEVIGRPTPADACAMIIGDMGTLPEADRPYQRYIWIPEPSKAIIGAVNYAMNLSCSRSTVIVQPTLLGNGQLLRWDLRRLAPRDESVTELMSIWEEFQYEPYFHIIKTTKDALPTNAIAQEPQPSDPTGSLRFKIENQLWYRSPAKTFFVWDGEAWIRMDSLVNFKSEKIATYGAHCGLEQSVLMQGLAKSNATVVRYDYFLTKALSTLDGGLYYKFAGIKAKPSGGKSSQDAFLASLGADEDLVAALRTDQRVAMFRSNVTGKPRRIDAFQGAGVRPGSGTGLITVTHDIADENVDPRRDPIRNLLDFNDDAREIIAEKPNGLHIFALFDGDGNLQDAAPDNVVKDHTIPSPHTARLQSAISCIRCHGPHEGFQPFTNDVQKMLSGLLDVFGDLDGRSSIPDTLDRLAGLYAGDLQKPVQRGRDDYNSAVFRTTGGMGVVDTSAVVSQIYGGYNFSLVDAYTACLELGYQVPERDAVGYLNQLLPPLQKDAVGVSPEDPVIGALKAGLKVNRYQWEQVYADAAFRAIQTRKAQNELRAQAQRESGGQK